MSHSIAELQEYITDMVVPDQRQNVNIIPDHITMLEGIKIKKQISNKRKAKKKTTISRRKRATLGMNNLPTREMLYTDALPLHRLWKDYMRQHLNFNEKHLLVPEVYDAAYGHLSKLLIKTDIHGAKMRILQSKCKTLVGLEGICIMETKNVLKLLGKDNRVRTVPKKECIFCIKLGNMELTIFGQHFGIRPADRSVKKIKTLINPLI